MKILLLIHLAATFYMIGLIWFVQVVHYPLFAHVGRDTFVDCQAFHLGHVTWVVGPGMLIEAATAALLVYLNPSSVLLKLGAGLLAVIWVSTWWLQVPKHNVLASGYDPAAHRYLVASNWIRTFAWTARGIVVGAVFIL